jgi:hypothetical protein
MGVVVVISQIPVHSLNCYLRFSIISLFTFCRQSCETTATTDLDSDSNS